MKKYLLILLACALTNCTKEKTILVPQEIQAPSWRAHESFFHNKKILSNSFASNNKLWMVGPYVFTEFDAARTDPIFYVNWELMPLSSKPAISSDFYAYPYPSGDALVIRANAFPVDNNGNIRLAVADLDPPFLAQAIIAASNYQAPVGAFNQSGQLLIAVRDTSGMSVGLIQLQISGSAPFQQLEVASARRIHLRRYDYLSHDIEWCRDRFLVGITYSAYLVYPTGEFKAIFNRPVHEFFAFHDTVYALSGTELYRSADWGETWQLYSTNFPVWYARFLR